MDLQTYTQVAEDALKDYGLSGAALRIVKSSNNAVFQVAAGNQQFALRVHRPGYRERAWIEAELEWLRAIRRDTGLSVPEPAAPIYSGRVGDKTVYCTLLTWLKGTHIPPSETTTRQAYQMGLFAGSLHEHSQRSDAVLQGEMPTLDIESKLADRSMFASIANPTVLSTLHTVFDTFARQLRIVIQELNLHQPQQKRIHSDLIWKNFLFHNNSPSVIDFDDCARGFFLYDLAPLLLGYLDEDNYSAIKDAVWEGYTSTNPQPEADKEILEALVAARFALSIQWIAANRSNPAISNRADAIITSRIQRLQGYLEDGVLKRGEIIF
jgi:Ser/Thr protein kinase RdoA (MazF antagonist)